MVYCEHFCKIFDNDWLYAIKKSECEICDGFLICKNNNHKNIENSKTIFLLNKNYKGITRSIMKISDDFIPVTTKGYILKSKCIDCKNEEQLIIKNNVVKIIQNERTCIHNNNYNDCIDCEITSKIENGYCKHSTFKIKHIIYCELCEKERGCYYKSMFIKNNNKYKCMHHNINCIDGSTIGKFPFDDISEYHEKCEFYVCKHDIFYTEECIECKKNLIINNKCKHNKKSMCKRCINLNHAWKGTTNICIHNNNIYKCFDCGIAKICSHNNIYVFCNKCDPNIYCFHNINKRLCRICDGGGLCKNNWCDNNGYKKYDNYCLRCVVYMFPDKLISRNYKTKELTVNQFVINNFNSLNWISDKKIINGCSRRRPDLLLDLGYQIIIIEIDENQHIDYDCSCENKRLMEISQDVNFRPIIFIRFNPDDYIDNKGKKISSCWSINNNGICIIKKEKEWNNRLNVLNNQIKYWINSLNQTDKTIEIVQLFYNGYINNEVNNEI